MNTDELHICRDAFERWVEISAINLTLTRRSDKPEEYAFAAQKAWEAWQFLWPISQPTRPDLVDDIDEFIEDFNNQTPRYLCSHSNPEYLLQEFKEFLGQPIQRCAEIKCAIGQLEPIQDIDWHGKWRIKSAINMLNKLIL